MAILVLIANWLHKTPIVLKCQRFKDSGSDKIELRGLKWQRLDLRDNEEEEGLDGFEDEDEEEDIGYVFFPFVNPPQKESNHPTNVDEGIKSLNHLVCISKIG